MLETLGVLAVVGLLSAVTVLGVKSAFIKHEANTLLNEANKRAVVVAGQIGFNLGHPTLSDFFSNSFSGATFNTQVVVDGLSGQFGIQLSGVDKAVCEQILKSIDAHTPLRRLSANSNKTVALKSCSDTSDFIMIYNNDLTGESGDAIYCATHADCDECATCNQTTHLCAGGCNRACKEGDTCGENDCVICDSETKTCQNKCDEVEYLQSNGTQYIDTGIKGKNTLRTEITLQELEISKGTAVFGTFDSNSSHVYYIYQQGSPEASFQPPWQVGMGDFENTSTLVDLNKHTFILDDNKVYLDGNILSTFTQQTFTTTRTLILFNMHKADDTLYTAAPQRLYSCKIVDNGTLVRDFIPVLSPKTGEEERKACMFDKVSKKLFCGVGTFDYGPKNNN